MKYAESNKLASDVQFSSKVNDQLNWDYAHYQAYPLAKNKIMLRLENNFDKFELEGVGEAINAPHGQIRYVDLNQFVMDLYQEANPKSTVLPSFVIKELSLSGNQLAADNNLYKAQNRWIGDDDQSRPAVHAPQDKNGMGGVALEP